MTSNKPYLIRALYEWLADNNATPYILVDSNHAEVDIPQGIAKDGQVVLNIAMSAVKDLQLTNSYISFSARFGGVSRDLYIPVSAVLAIYSREDGAGMMFAETEQGDSGDSGESVDEAAVSQVDKSEPTEPKQKKQSSKKANKRPSLKLVD